MNKRGQEGLSINTIIIAIIAIVVLLLVVTFFTGGLGTVADRIRSIFQGGTSGADRDFAVSTCEQACVQSRDSGNPAGSSFCLKRLTVDMNSNNKIEDNERAVDCWSSSPIGLGLSCSGVKDSCTRS